jgi:uncharacterized coiled-coil protein SlyX
MTYALIDLATAERQVREGEKHVATQKKVVQELSGNAEIRLAAEELLDTLQRTLQSQRMHCERIRTDLGSKR